jgi:hypothetical protein
VILALFQGFTLTFDADVGFEKGDFALTFDADVCALLFRKEDDVRYLLAVAPGFPHSNTDLASKYRTDLSTSPIYRRPSTDLCLYFNRRRHHCHLFVRRRHHCHLFVHRRHHCHLFLDLLRTAPQPVTSTARFGLRPTSPSVSSSSRTPPR